MAKTKLTPERQGAIVKLIREGNYIYRACQAVGISQQTYEQWVKRGEQGDGEIYIAFLEAIKKAESEFIAENVAIIQTAAKKNWFAAAWLLERKYPAEFGKRVELEVGPSKVLLALQESAREELVKPGLIEGKDEADN